MDRRDVLRSLFFRPSTAKFLDSDEPVTAMVEKMGIDTATSFKSKWHQLDSMSLPGEEFYAQGLQDWYIKDRELCCIGHGENRMLHILTHQLSAANNSFKATISFRFLSERVSDDYMENYTALRLGIGVISDDQHAVAPGNKGIDAGVTINGCLFIGKTFSAKKIDPRILTEKIRLQLSVMPVSTGGNYAKLKALDNAGNTIATVSSAQYDALAWRGDIALISHFKTSKENTGKPTIAVSNFEIEGEKIIFSQKNNPQY